MRKLVMALTFVALVVAVVLVTATPSQAHCRSFPHSYNPYGYDHPYGSGCGWPSYGYDPYYPSYPYGYGGPYTWPVPPVVIPQTPPVVIQPTPPTTYIEKQPAEPQKQAEQPGQFWYYCEEKKIYFPYLRECPSPWLKVVPETTPPTK